MHLAVEAASLPKRPGHMRAHAGGTAGSCSGSMQIRMGRCRQSSPPTFAVPKAPLPWLLLPVRGRECNDAITVNDGDDEIVNTDDGKLDANPEPEPEYDEYDDDDDDDNSD